MLLHVEGDGCGSESPLIGYRYRCTKCANHDVCETCHATWDNGKGTIANHLAQQKLSTNAEDHFFKLWKDKSFKSLVKSQSPAAMTQPAMKKPKPNDPCNCGSGKKYKKCCSSEWFFNFMMWSQRKYPLDFKYNHVSPWDERLTGVSPCDLVIHYFLI
jgi:hypothetical protein